jgi:hypothetical protein
MTSPKLSRFLLPWIFAALDCCQELLLDFSTPKKCLEYCFLIIQCPGKRSLEKPWRSLGETQINMRVTIDF